MYADVLAVRKLAGLIDPADISDAEITEGILYSDSFVELETGHIGYTPDDPIYPTIKQASAYIASSWCRDHYRDNESQSDKHYNKGKDLCKTIRDSSPESLFVVSQPYKTYPLNPKGIMHRSLPGSGGDTTLQPTGQHPDDFFF